MINNKNTNINNQNYIINVQLENINNKIYANSKDIANKLGKEHSKLCNKIKEVLGIVKFGDTSTSEFIAFEKTVINPQNKQEYKEYLLDKDAFTLLLFNYTGYNDFKKAYINAFNKMEQALLNKAENKIEEEKEEDNEISFYFQNKFYNNDKEQKYIINDPMLCKNYFGYKIINDRPMLKLVDIAGIINKPVLMIREYVGLDYVYSNLLDRNKTKDKLFAYYLHKFRMEFMFIKNNNLFEKDDDDKEISFTEIKLLGERLKSATECAQILGTTPQMFGKITNKLNLKTSEYGEYFKEKLKNGKDCQVFKYKENVLKKVQEYLFY